jgi:hypothetical protein
MVSCEACHLEKTKTERRLFVLSDAGPWSAPSATYSPESFLDPGAYLDGLRNDGRWIVDLQARESGAI